MRPGPEALARLDLDALVGLSVEQARAAVSDAGGVLRPVAPQDAVRADYRPDRVTVVVEDGRVISQHGIGEKWALPLRAARRDTPGRGPAPAG